MWHEKFLDHRDQQAELISYPATNFKYASKLLRELYYIIPYPPLLRITHNRFKWSMKVSLKI